MSVIRFRLRILILISILFISFSSYAAQKVYGDVEVSEVVRVYDGDTITVNIAGFPDIIGKKINIRINGIDTPEIRDKNQIIKEFAKYVRDYVRNFLKDSKKVFLYNMKRDKYFRIVADVVVDNESLGVELIEKGFAKPYDGGKKSKWKVEDIPKIEDVPKVEDIPKIEDIPSEPLESPDQK